MLAGDTGGDVSVFAPVNGSGMTGATDTSGEGFKVNGDGKEGDEHAGVAETSAEEVVHVEGDGPGVRIDEPVFAEMTVDT